MSHIKKIPWKIKILIFSLSCFLVFLWGYFFILHGLLSKISLIKKKNQLLVNAMNVQQKELKNIENKNASINFSPMQEKWLKEVSNQYSLKELFWQFHGIAQRNQVMLQLLQPISPVYQEGLNVQSIRMTAQGNYFALIKFLRDILALSPRISIDDFMMKSFPNSSGSVQLTGVIKVYWREKS